MWLANSKRRSLATCFHESPHDNNVSYTWKYHFILIIFIPFIFFFPYFFFSQLFSSFLRLSSYSHKDVRSGAHAFKFILFHTKFYPWKLLIYIFYVFSYSKIGGKKFWLKIIYKRKNTDNPLISRPLIWGHLPLFLMIIKIGCSKIKFCRLRLLKKPNFFFLLA